MYLRIKQGSKKDHLRKINQLILKIFEYTVDAQAFDRMKFEEFVREDEVWSAKSYRPGEPFYNKIENLFTFSQAERKNIYEMMQHDMEFDQHIDDPGFVFEEQQLEKQQKEAVKELILHLYDNLFRKGKFIFQSQPTGYEEFKNSLFEQNLSDICPACLTWQTDLKDYGEVDHYFPKKSYPALTFHPINLAVVCSECNGFLVKGEKDIYATSNLTELYIPYLRHAEKEVELGVKWIEEDGKDGEQEKVKKMVMVPRGLDVKLINKRIQNLDNLFSLSKRWTKRMNRIIEYELKHLQRKETLDEVVERIHNRTKEQKERAEEDKTKLLEAATLEYIENEGRQSFLDEWRERQKEKRIMSEFNADA